MDFGHAIKKGWMSSKVKVMTEEITNVELDTHASFWSFTSGNLYTFEHNQLPKDNKNLTHLEIMYNPLKSNYPVGLLTVLYCQLKLATIYTN